MPKLSFDIITIFPEMFKSVFSESIIKRAIEKKKIEINISNLRDFSSDKHKKVDDKPYGGGAGMIMKPEPIFRAIGYIKSERSTFVGAPNQKSKVVLLTPQGERLTQGLAKKLSKLKHLILICGHYEGVDERVRKYLVDLEISIGDYVLTGGEIPAMVLVDCITRLIPGVLGEKESLTFESFQGNLLEYSQYTRPKAYRGLKVPQVLLSGNHKRIEKWRKRQALKITKQKRPDLLKGVI